MYKWFGLEKLKSTQIQAAAVATDYRRRFVLWHWFNIAQYS